MILALTKGGANAFAKKKKVNPGQSVQSMLADFVSNCENGKKCIKLCHLLFSFCFQRHFLSSYGILKTNMSYILCITSSIKDLPSVTEKLVYVNICTFDAVIWQILM